MKVRVDSPQRRMRVFRLYQKAKHVELKALEYRPEGRAAIAVSEDDHAKRWQGVQMRISIMESYLSGCGYPNWFHARWLPYEEAKRRNDSYWEVAPAAF